MAGPTCSMSISSGTALAQTRPGIPLTRWRTCGKGRCDMRSKITNHFRTHLWHLCALAVLAFFIVPMYAQSPANALPAGNGKDLVAVACTQCHGLKLIMSLRDGPVGWRRFVDDMILRRAAESAGSGYGGAIPVTEFWPGHFSDAEWLEN